VFSQFLRGNNPTCLGRFDHSESMIAGAIIP
jgi:hypothetical protein